MQALQDPYRIFTGALPERYTGALQEFYRRYTGSLQELYTGAQEPYNGVTVNRFLLILPKDGRSDKCLEGAGSALAESE